MTDTRIRLLFTPDQLRALGREVARRCAYMVCPGGRKFQDFEIAKWSKPIELASKKDREEAANMHGKRAS